MPVCLYIRKVLCVLLMGERDIIMRHSFYRLDLSDIADWIRNPLLRICAEHRLAQLPDKALLDLTELLVDFDINSRLSWTHHSAEYRKDDFCNFFGPAYLYNDDFFCDFDDLRGTVSSYLESRLEPLMGRMWMNDHVYELRRLHGWLVIIDIGVTEAPEPPAPTPMAFDATERRGGLEIRRYSAGQVVIALTNDRKSSERKEEIVPMGTIRMIQQRPHYTNIRPPEDLTDEQFEWMAEVEQSRIECNKKYPTPKTTASNLRAGEAHKRKRSIVRAKLGPIRSEKNDLYFDPHRDGYSFVSSHQLDDNEVRQTSEHHTPTLRPVRRQRRSSRRSAP